MEEYSFGTFFVVKINEKNYIKDIIKHENHDVSYILTSSLPVAKRFRHPYSKDPKDNESAMITNLINDIDGKQIEVYQSLKVRNEE